MFTETGTVVALEGLDGKFIKIPKAGGGQYDGFILTYRNEKGETKPIKKHENALKYPNMGSEVYGILKTFKVGDKFTLSKEKVFDEKQGKEVWVDRSFTLGHTEIEQDEMPEVTPVPTGYSKIAAKEAEALGEVPTTQEQIRKNWEEGKTFVPSTKRPDTNTSIVRQSSLKAAVEYVNHTATANKEVEDVIELAKRFVTFVETGQ